MLISIIHILPKTLLEIVFLFLFSYSFAGEGDGEKYEKSEVKGRDHTFHKFMKRVSVCPEQILRYGVLTIWLEQGDRIES